MEIDDYTYDNVMAKYAPQWKISGAMDKAVREYPRMCHGILRWAKGTRNQVTGELGIRLWLAARKWSTQDLTETLSTSESAAQLYDDTEFAALQRV
jgi:hypothetical protein